MATFKTMADVRAANKAIGNHWFDRATMRHFNSRIESSLIGGRYFITSEDPNGDMISGRKFSVRKVNEDGSINTVGKFWSYLDKQDAKDAIRELLKGEKAKGV